MGCHTTIGSLKSPPDGPILAEKLTKLHGSPDHVAAKRSVGGRILAADRLFHYRENRQSFPYQMMCIDDDPRKFHC